jgi:nucleoside-diphosphate-sugar epimerase
MAMKTALVVGATGIVGRNLAARLDQQAGWVVYGMSRRPTVDGNVIPLASDLQDTESVVRAVKDIAPTHVFLATWLRQPTEAENIRVNAGMVRNLLNRITVGLCRARRAGHGTQALPGPLRGIRQRHIAGDAFSRGASATSYRKLLLCTGR